MRIENLTNLGEGIAREGETGWVVMIPHVIPGELVKCRVFRNHANYSEATLASVFSQSEARHFQYPRCYEACPLARIFGCGARGGEMSTSCDTLHRSIVYDAAAKLFSCPLVWVATRSTHLVCQLSFSAAVSYGMLCYRIAHRWR